MQQNIRNFCIIAHIDHGKSTLADRLLEMTQTVEKRKMKEQLLDQMDLERERGITIKLQPVQMIHNAYVLNLIDTPGHVDFSYEVSRSLAAVEGAILLVDATQGVQAQTISTLYQAIEQDLDIIPVINKIDLPNADIAKTKKEIMHILGCAEEEIIAASGKTGEGVDRILAAIVECISPPKGNPSAPLRALIFDSVYNSYKGVLAYVRIVDGAVEKEGRIMMMAAQNESTIVEMGHFKPNLVPCERLAAGDIGYIATGFKKVADCRVGDTITLSGTATQPLPGYKKVTPMVYASFYPTEGDDYHMMRDALEKLTLNDSAFTFELESNRALGRGFRCGFLGLLHMEIIQERLKREFHLTPTVTTPSVVYHVKKKNAPEIIPIYAPTELPDPSVIEWIAEPYVTLDIVVPAAYLGSVMELLNATRARYHNTEYIDQDRVLLTFHAPLPDVIVNLHDNLKSVSSGYASMNYEMLDYRPSDLVRLDILVAEEQVDAFARIVPRERAFAEGKATVEKLKEVIPKHHFMIPLQAAIGGKVIARETIKAYRKDVLAKLYGGDVTRKMKLLQKQKKGKKRMKQSGRVAIPPEAFLSVLRK